MIVDITGIILLPGNGGLDCLGNGENGECCCEECDYICAAMAMKCHRVKPVMIHTVPAQKNNSGTANAVPSIHSVSNSKEALKNASFSSMACW